MESMSHEMNLSSNFVDILDDSKEEKSRIRLPDLQGRITFQQVSFVHSYYAAIPKLYEMNLYIKPGELVAFVGRLHSGVSIPIQLLLGFYKITSGDIVSITVFTNLKLAYVKFILCSSLMISS